ncbi:MAG: hypothetical protein JNJ54_15125 [Myxococcaceae bacterium]|nr:hypothetical protein [Myxococcaceae bacterium]
MKKRQDPEPLPDLSSVAAIRSAFERRRPMSKPAGSDGFPEEPTPEEYAKLEAFARFVRGAIPLVLGTETADAPRALSTWSVEQRTFLEELTKVPEEAHLDVHSLSATLSKLGAIDVGPNGDDRYLRRYVGLAEPSGLEHEVDGRPLWLTLRLCLMGRLARSEWLRSVAALDGPARIDLARRATDDAYQLMRRWPRPLDLTPEIEREDATQLYDLLLPALEMISTAERRAAIAKEEAAERPNESLLLLLSLGQANQGEPVTARPESLISALTLFTNTTIGVRFARSLPADGRRALISAIELVPNNLVGWEYLELLEPQDRQRTVIGALAGFKRAARPGVVARVSRLIQTFDDAGRAELRTLVAKGGPNAKAIDAALNGQS